MKRSTANGCLADAILIHGDGSTASIAKADKQNKRRLKKLGPDVEERGPAQDSGKNFMQLTSNTKPFATQREKLRALMFSREGQWVPLPDVQALGIAQHGARFKELRNELAPQGYKIENRMEHGTDGIVRSWYMLTRRAPISSFSAGKREETERERPAGDTRHERAKQFERKFRPGWQPRPFSEKRMAQDDCFVLTPPEPRQ